MALTDAQKLIDGVFCTYGELTTYQDDGSVSIQTKDENALPRTTFETRFLRPSYFRFKFASPHPHAPLSHIVTTCVCGFDGDAAYLWTKHYEDRPRVQTYESLMMAVAGATGISSGSAHTIAQLLLEDFEGPALLSLENAKIGDDEAIEETVCQSVHGKLTRADVNITLFIDPNTKLVHQLITRFANFTSIEVRRNIRLNEPLDKAAFSRPNGEI